MAINIKRGDVKIMKKFFSVFFVTLILLFGCATSKTEMNYGSSIQTSLHQTTISKKYQFNRTSFNSFCFKQQIPSNLKLWSSVAYKDYETGNLVHQKVYLKDDKNNDQISSDVYRLNLMIERSDTTFVVLHRSTH